jgi:thioredoxin 1
VLFNITVYVNQYNVKMKFSEVINSDTPVLVDFHAEWCDPCKQFGPIIQEVKNEMGEDVIVVKMDIDKNEKLAQRLNIMSVPTIIIYRNGVQKFRASGVQSKTSLINMINEIKAEI